MAAPNIISAASIYCKTAVMAVTDTATAIVSNASSSGKVLKISSLTVANIHASTAATVTVDVYRSSTAYRIGSTITVPIHASIGMIERGGPIYLEEGDSLRVTASASSLLEAVASYEEIA